MVRIINGEIVSDNDPRVVGAQQRRSGGGGGGGGTQGGAGYGRVASLFDQPSASAAGGGNASGQGGGGRGGGGGGAAGPPGPIMKLAEMIGVDGRFVTIPGALGVQANQVPVIYLMIAALMVLFGGWKVGALIVFAYVILNQKGSQTR